MRGFKAFNKDLTCRGFQYEIGHTYEFDGELIPCEQGFHFCKSITECYEFYDMSEDTRICVVDAIGDIATKDEIKYCTNKIVIVEEVTEEWKRKGNSCSTSTGYFNTGGYNTGDRNTGDKNTGDWNSGEQNSGDFNSGDYNSGNFNSGSHNTGFSNSGDGNTGDRNAGTRNAGCKNTGHKNNGDLNTGSLNAGDRNTGNSNLGQQNTGNLNLGDSNTGNRNIGDFNTGNENVGDRNTGDWNTGNGNTGVFNENTPTITFFDKPSDWTYEQWLKSDAKKLLDRIDRKVVEWVSECDMTDEEKEQNPEYKTAGGYLREFEGEENTQMWWDLLTEQEKQVFRDLPNYDEEKFARIVGITRM